MSFTAQPPLPIVTTSRFHVGQDKIMSFRDFLGVLKRPGSKPSLASIDRHDPLPVPENQHALQIIGLVADDRSILCSPLSYPEGPVEDGGRQDSCPSPAAEIPKATIEPAFFDTADTMEAPKVARTYVTKCKPPLPPTENLQRDLPLIPTLFSTISQEQTPGSLEADSQVRVTELADEDPCKNRDPRAQELQTPIQYKTQALQQTDKWDTQPTAPPAVHDCTEKQAKRKKKSRRAPVNELALVPGLPVDLYSPGAVMVESSIHSLQCSANVLGQHERSHKSTATPISISGRTNRQVSCESNRQKIGKVKKPNDSNIQRTVTTSRHDLVLTRRNSIDPQDFRFPPATPQNARSTEWKPGSGFEGIRLERSIATRLSSYNINAMRAKSVRFVVPSLRPLGFSTQVSPSIRTSDSRLPRRAPRPLPKPSAASHVLAYHRLSPNHGGCRPHIDSTVSDTEASHYDKCQEQLLSQPPLPKPRKSHSPVQRAAERCPSVRGPSRSERNGWLKRRRITSYADRDGLKVHHFSIGNHQAEACDDSEQVFDAHNCMWYSQARAEPRFQVSMQRQDTSYTDRPTPERSSTSFHLATSRSLEVQDSQEQPEPDSLELGHYPNYLVPDASLDAGKYFKKAVKQLSSPEKERRSIVRCKSLLQGIAYDRPSQLEQGHLKLGVTPRLKRTMSSVPFRPPFNAL